MLYLTCKLQASQSEERSQSWIIIELGLEELTLSLSTTFSSSLRGVLFFFVVSTKIIINCKNFCFKFDLIYLLLDLYNVSGWLVLSRWNAKFYTRHNGTFLHLNLILCTYSKLVKSSKNIFTTVQSVLRVLGMITFNWFLKFLSCLQVSFQCFHPFPSTTGIKKSSSLILGLVSSTDFSTCYC